MLYLLWGLINIAAFVGFIVLCFRITQRVKEQFGSIAALIFVFIVLSFIGRNNDKNKEPNSTTIKTWKFINDDSLRTNAKYIKHIELEKTLISKYELGFLYGKNKRDDTYLPVSAYTTTTGFISGTSWAPTSITINLVNEKGKFEYQVLGTVEWQILGITFYYEAKDYQGFLEVK